MRITRSTRQRLVLLGVLAAALALTLGAAERGGAETVSLCAGKPICASITDQAQASRSPVGTEHYMSDSITVSNAGSTSSLVNVTVTVTWADVGSASTSSDYRPLASDPDCTVSGTRTLTCTTPKSLRPGDVVTYEPLVFRTSTDNPDDQATATTVTVTATAKEQAKPNKNNPDPHDAVVTIPNSTSYEGSPETDLSTAGSGLATTLATAQAGQQFSKLPVSAGAPRGLFELHEANYGGTVVCPAGLTCFGQQVTTVATGVAPVNLQSTYTGPLGPGVTENSIVVVHTRTVGGQVTISAACSG
ncbi:MAG: hypothetical protein M3364_08850, partial [Actinomycetota bacterium]|nr:hypothetical protein [Actinomycetota bacterium]